MKNIMTLVLAGLLSSTVLADRSDNHDLCQFFENNIWIGDVSVDNFNYLVNTKFDQDTGNPVLYYYVKEYIKDSGVRKDYTFEQTFPFSFSDFTCVQYKNTHDATLAVTAQQGSQSIQLIGTIGVAHQEPSKYLYRLYDEAQTINLFGLADKG